MQRAPPQEPRVVAFQYQWAEGTQRPLSPGFLAPGSYFLEALIPSRYSLLFTFCLSLTIHGLFILKPGLYSPL